MDEIALARHLDVQVLQRAEARMSIIRFNAVAPDTVIEPLDHFVRIIADNKFDVLLCCVCIDRSPKSFLLLDIE